MSDTLRRNIPIIITAFLVGFMLVDYFFVVPAVTELASDVRSGVVVVAAFSIGLGMINLLKIHSMEIQKRSKGWYFSVILIVSMIGTFVLGLIPPMLTHPAYLFVFQNVKLPLDSTVYSLIAFFIITGAYRAFRMRGTYGTAFAIPGILVMICSIPIFELFWPGFPSLGSWLTGVWNTGGQRGIKIAVAIGAIVMFLRVLVGKETGYLGGRE